MTSERIARLQARLDELEVPDVTRLPIWSDPRVHELRHLSDAIAFFRTPFSLAFIGVALVLALPFLLLAFGLRWSAKLVTTAAMKQLTYALKLGTATKGISH